MPNSTARRTRHNVYPPLLEKPPPTVPVSSNSLHLVPVVNNTPPQGAKSPFEPKDYSAASIGATKPEPPNVKASPELERMINVKLDGPQSFGTTQPACSTKTTPSAPVSAVPPSSWVASIRAAAEARIEQEEVEFRAVEESIKTEISRLQILIAEQKVILTTAREKKDKSIEKARGIIEAKDETLLEAREPTAPTSSLNDTLAVDLEAKVPLTYFMSSLPPELLLPILALVDMEWTPLRLVCKQWNSIILNNGHFWNDIVLTSRPDSANPAAYGYEPWQPRQQLCRSLSAVEEALKRSKSAPLSITLDFIDFAGKPPDIDNFGDTSFNAGSQRIQKRRDAVKLVGKEMSRIRTLSVFATGGIQSGTVEGSFEPDRAVVLEKLYIKGRMYDSSAEDMQFSQLISAANLRTLRFLDRATDHLGSAAAVNWSGMIDMSVERLFVDWEALVTPLTLPSLRILRLGGWSLDTLQKLRTPRLDSLVIHDSAYPLGPDVSHFDPVDVLSVTSLYLWRNFSILDMLNIPTVTHIDLQSDCENGQEIDSKWIGTIFKGAEARFPNLTSLVLCTYTSSGSIGKGLAHLPHLVDLCVDAKHRKMAAVFWNDLSRTVKGRERTKTPRLLPNLKRLHVRLYHERTSSIEELATKVKVARELAGRCMTLLLVEWKDGVTSNFVGERRQKVNAAAFPRQRSVGKFIMVQALILSF
jgi:hypothetical protein